MLLFRRQKVEQGRVIVSAQLAAQPLWVSRIVWGTHEAPSTTAEGADTWDWDDSVGLLYTQAPCLSTTSVLLNSQAQSAPGYNGQ